MSQASGSRDPALESRVQKEMVVGGHGVERSGQDLRTSAGEKDWVEQG